MKPQLENKIKSYLVFTLGGEDFAVNVSKVLNILEMVRVTKIPNSPVYMRGVINLRGQVLPVIDTRVKFNITASEDNKNTCIIVMDLLVDNHALKMGMVVDAVKEVLEINPSQVLEPPTIGSEFETKFIYGMVEIGDHFIMLLDIDGIISAREVVKLKTMRDEAGDQIEDVNIEL
jgi:purine-binding chemotaxis protein CheW